MDATADKAPPPLAEPSSLVKKIEPILVASWKASACIDACCPMVASIIRIISSGFMMCQE
jgi:hypothetical protein